eukprot:24436_1
MLSSHIEVMKAMMDLCMFVKREIWYGYWENCEGAIISHHHAKGYMDNSLMGNIQDNNLIWYSLKVIECVIIYYFQELLMMNYFQEKIIKLFQQFLFIFQEVLGLWLWC